MKSRFWCFLGFAFPCACRGLSMEDLSPEELFRLTVANWRSRPSLDDWSPWKDFQEELFSRFQKSAGNNRLEIIGAVEEGILIIEKSVFQLGEGENPPRDAALSQLYTTYGKILSSLDPRECHDLALDPHTLLIGAENISRESQPDTGICIENAENSLRNAASLDATNTEAESLLQKLTGDETTVHKRKPKEFVSELFDSFADTFDEKLLDGLQYKVPGLVGELAAKLSQNSEYHRVLDAGCGTGLAGRHLRPLVNAKNGILVGVDASKKMLDIAAKCTTTSGCGLKVESEGGHKDENALYDSLLDLDLEEMNLSNTLVGKHNGNAFDLIVAADVLVYFGSLEKLMETFRALSTAGAKLIFSCELATDEEAPLGWRLLSSGRFAHTKTHAMGVAAKVGYKLLHYEEIVPRMEKGEPVRGHLFGFEADEIGQAGEAEL